MRDAAVVAGLVFGMMSGTAQASYIFTFSQTALGVVETGAGSLDVIDLISGGAISSVPFVAPSTSTNVVGMASGSAALYFANFLNTEAFGTGPETAATSGSGPLVGFGSLTEFGPIAVPDGYTSGDFLIGSTAFYAGATFASLGLTPGTYTYSYTYASESEGVDEFRAADVLPVLDTITVQVSAVPLPASAPMFGAAVLALGLVGFGVKRKKAAAAA